MLLLLAGKTSCGKTTIAKELEKLGIKNIITYTSRPMRNGESQGDPYHFVTDEEFQVLSNQGYFAEETKYKVADGSIWRYGTAIGDIQKDNMCLIVNPDGLKYYSKLTSVDIYTVYLYADNGTIWNRLRQRGDDAAEATRRLEADNEDFKDILDYCDIAIKNNGNDTPEDVAKAIKYLYYTHK